MLPAGHLFAGDISVTDSTGEAAFTIWTKMALGHGKRPVMVQSISVGGSNKSVTNYRKPVFTHNSIH